MIDLDTSAEVYIRTPASMYGLFILRNAIVATEAVYL